MLLLQIQRCFFFLLFCYSSDSATKNTFRSIVITKKIICINAFASRFFIHARMDKKDKKQIYK